MISKRLFMGMASVLLAIPLLSSAQLESIPKCTLVPSEWADGDSFSVKTPDGKTHTFRIYGADCIEKQATDDSDARRLRDQRRYFGIKDIEIAKSHGDAAALEVKEILAKPFTVHTAWADGRGDGKFKRFYAFIETSDGKDLATELVQKGLARALGVTRSTPYGQSSNEYKAALQDKELLAARKGHGAWASTDWDTIAEDRRLSRQEEEELQAAQGKGPLPDDFKINPNQAARDELMQLPGIGEKTANLIIENRPFQTPADLQNVPGIGPATLEKITPYLSME